MKYGFQWMQSILLKKILSSQEKGIQLITNIKKNQKHLLADIQQFTTASPNKIDSSFKYDFFSSSKFTKVHIDKYSIDSCAIKKYFKNESWENFIHKIYHVKKDIFNKKTQEVKHTSMFLISNSKQDAFKIIQNRWAIENKLHKPIDLIFKMDKSYYKTDFSKKIFNSFKYLAFFLISSQISFKKTINSFKMNIFNLFLYIDKL